MKKLFTERYGRTEPRVNEELDPSTTTGLISLVQSYLDQHWFGEAFPSECQEGQGNSGCDSSRLFGAFGAYKIIWPAEWLKSEQIPEDGLVFDMLEFSFEHIALPNAEYHHSYWGHHHYSYDRKAGRVKFTEEINRIFERHGMAFEMVGGEVTRMAPMGLQEALAGAVFDTGDDELNRLLETAREKFLNKSLDVRKEALEKLWDSWERLKTVESGKDKLAQVTAILDKAASEPNFRKQLDDEAKLLTWIGNNFMIRHTETNKTPITESAHVDYLFHRMFAMIRLLLRSSGRGG